MAPDLFEFARQPSQAVLVSAYDLHFGHFHGLKGARGGPLDWLQHCRVIFLDSGGYELAPDFDSSEPKSPEYEPEPGYGASQYRDVLDRIRDDPARRSFIISNFDWVLPGRRRSVERQIADARRLFRDYPGHSHSFILKPWNSKDRFVTPDDLSPRGIGDLAGFDIIGVTEKDLGSDVIERLRCVAKLRRRLDQAGIQAPIHVWGGLDPILTPLFFFAGAQIFDGISWLRYSYTGGLAVNRESFVVTAPEFGIGTRRPVAHQLASICNCSYLTALASQLRQWVDAGGRSFSMFEPCVRGHLERAHALMVSEIQELNGG